jgi:hypothetical protein
MNFLLDVLFTGISDALSGLVTAILELLLRLR